MKKVLIFLGVLIVIGMIIPKNKEEKINPYKKYSYYKEINLERYNLYKEMNPFLKEDQVIKNVNMNLDKNHYEYRLPALYKNTELVLVNKYYYLEEKDTPRNLEIIDIKYAKNNMKLVKEAKEAFEKLANSAKEENLNIIAMSTYRSYEYQEKLYHHYKEQDGEKKADTYSARAGHSEHQTGLSVDVYNEILPYTEFSKTKEYEWMINHAHEYGFILRFPKGKEQETGYQEEAWHYRYVGIENATYIKNHNITLEEYIATKKDW